MKFVSLLITGLVCAGASVPEHNLQRMLEEIGDEGSYADDVEELAPVLYAVQAEVSFAGVVEAVLVADKGMQTKFTTGFANAIGVSVSDVSITQIGSTTITIDDHDRRSRSTINSRKLGGVDDELSVTFKVMATSDDAAERLKNDVETTTVAEINEGITAAGVTGVTTTSLPKATVVITTLAPTPAPTKVVESTLAPTPAPTQDGDLSDGEIAAIVICVLIFFGGFAIGLWWANNHPTDQPGTGPGYGGTDPIKPGYGVPQDQVEYKLEQTNAYDV